MSVAACSVGNPTAKPIQTLRRARPSGASA